MLIRLKNIYIFKLVAHLISSNDLTSSTAWYYMRPEGIYRGAGPINGHSSAVIGTSNKSSWSLCVSVYIIVVKCIWCIKNCCMFNLTSINILKLHSMYQFFI